MQPGRAAWRIQYGDGERHNHVDATRKGLIREPDGNRDCLLRRGGLSRPLPRPSVRYGNSTRPGSTSANSRSWVATFEVTEKPDGFVSRGRLRQGRGGGGRHCSGGVFGLLMGAGFLVLPEIGLVVVAGPVAAVLKGAIEGPLAGTGLGSLAGSLVGWGVPKDWALKYEKQVKGGKFLVFVRSIPGVVARAQGLLVAQEPDHIGLYEPPTS